MGEEAGLKKASKEKEKAEVQKAGAGAAVAEKIVEAADEVGAEAGVGRGAEVGSRREEMGGEAARYLPHLRGREVFPAGEAGAELGGIAGTAKREGSKMKVGVR